MSLVKYVQTVGAFVLSLFLRMQPTLRSEEQVVHLLLHGGDVHQEPRGQGEGVGLAVGKSARTLLHG